MDSKETLGYVGHIRCAETFNTAAACEVYGDTEMKNLKLLDLGCTWYWIIGTNPEGEVRV